MDSMHIQIIKDKLAGQLKTQLTSFYVEALPAILQVCEVLDKVAHDAENKLEKINNKYQLELKMVYIVEKRKAPETHDNLPKMDMDMDFKHQSITTTVAISTTSSPVSEEHDLSWKQALTKSQRKKLKKQAKAEEKNTFFRNKTRLLLRLHHLAPLLMVNTRHSKSPRHRCLGLLQND
ncbi:hypothetical protein RCL_jg11359.t1 [Rhizophagus clarus]|uniref:Uncharacterized protein n=1 Tax=Rhizophagus clarus TaxID=94130 RepID=A0A8H3LMB0_9GLOM|nr:hypothetical protein RCL_jg11359.t1 [Rhizophagus clarus]